MVVDVLLLLSGIASSAAALLERESSADAVAAIQCREEIGGHGGCLEGYSKLR